MEKLDRTTSVWMGDVESESPNENVSHLQTLLRKAEASVREACREGGSSTSVTTNPIGPKGAASMWRRHKDEELKCHVQACARHNLLGKTRGRETRSGSMFGRPLTKDGHVELSLKAKYDPRKVRE